MTPEAPEAYIKEQIAKQGLSAEDVLLGLDRISAVLGRTEIRPPPFIFTIAGTNGKGSCANLIYQALLVAGYPAAFFSSPHLLRFNERAQINGEEAHNEEWLASLERVHRAKQKVKLTYFEYCTLAALDIFSRRSAFPWVLEVGLGGRLDAVNVLDTNCAVITSIDIDHTDRLGKDRVSIGHEKMGIARRGVPLICGEPSPPAEVINAAEQAGAKLLCVNRDYGVRGKGLTECCFAEEPIVEYYASRRFVRGNTDDPQTDALKREPAVLCATNEDQLAVNLATAWQALNVFDDKWDADLVAATWHKARLIGRWQKIRFGQHLLILDTGHNPQAARILVHRLQEKIFPYARAEIIFAMRADKDWQEFLKITSPHIKEWHLFPLFMQTDEGAPKEISVAKTSLERALNRLHARTHWYDHAKQLLQSLRLRSEPTVFWVCGSFHTLGEVMQQLREDTPAVKAVS